MSKPVILGDVTMSRLGFGCASLMRKSRRERLTLLDTAFDSGVRHFDVARMYGLGATEAEVGKFMIGRRDEVTIATKFGLGVSRWMSAIGPYQAPARAALESLPRARRAVKQSSSEPAPPRTYSAGDARESLELSLRQLGTDYVDILFVHDPRPSDDIRSDELLEFFTEARQAGKIRSWGVSQDAYPELKAIDRLGPAAVLQVRADIFSREALARPGVTFGVMGRAYTAILAAFRADPTMRTRWARTLDIDLNDPETVARLLLHDALAYNDSGVVLYSTLDPARLRRTALQSDTGSEPTQVNKFRELVHSEVNRTY